DNPGEAVRTTPRRRSGTQQPDTASFRARRLTFGKRSVTVRGPIRGRSRCDTSHLVRNGSFREDADTTGPGRKSPAGSADGGRSGRDRALAPVLPLRPLRRGTDVEVEDRRRQVERAAGVGDIHHAADPPLDRRRPQQQVRLLTGVTPPLEVLRSEEHTSEL